MLSTREQAIRQVRKGWPAMLAAFVLALQMLIPGAAISQNGQDGLLLCTDHGAQYGSLASGSPEHRHKHTPFGGLACEQCVIASLAAVASTPPVLVTPSVAVQHVEPPTPAAPKPRTRAPPRPPSQGPPLNS